MGNRACISYRGFWSWWRCQRSFNRNQHCLALLLELHQGRRFLWIRLSCLNISQICSAPPVEFVPKDGFAKFRDFGQFWHWRAADDLARLVMLPLPATNQFCTNGISELFTSSSVHVILLPHSHHHHCIVKLYFVHSAQNYAHKLSLASRRADSHGHILSKSSTNLEKWGAVQKRSASHIDGSSFSTIT